MGWGGVTGSVVRGREHRGEPSGRGDETGRLKKRDDSGLCCCSRATATLLTLLRLLKFVDNININYNDHDNAKKIHINPRHVSQL